MNFARNVGNAWISGESLSRSAGIAHIVVVSSSPFEGRIKLLK
jgi:hypothetical protein